MNGTYRHANPRRSNESFLLGFDDGVHERSPCLLVDAGHGVDLTLLRLRDAAGHSLEPGEELDVVIQDPSAPADAGEGGTSRRDDGHPRPDSGSHDPGDAAAGGGGD